jgi:hypothetical protein
MNGIMDAPPVISTPARDPRSSTRAIRSESIKKEETEEEESQAQPEDEEAEADPEQMVQQPRELSSFEKHQVFQEILHRFFESEYRFSAAPTTGTGKDEKYEKDSLAAAKYGWMLLITRLLTRGRVKEGTTQLETVLQAKESLVSHILDDFKERYIWILE